MKYRRKILTHEIGLISLRVFFEISERFEIEFIEIGYETDHVHFLIQSIPSYTVSQIVRVIKSITARELYRIHPEIKQIMWGGNLWTSGYYANTVGQYGNKEAIRKYVENQEKEYEKIRSGLLKLF